MAVTDAVIFTKWVEDADGVNVPNAVSDIYAWAIANDAYLPEGESGKGPFGRYEDLTGQANVHQRILDNLGIFAARLEVTDATAAQFASDPRIWTLGYKRFDEDGNMISSNWDQVLSAGQRQEALDYVTANSDIEVQQLSNRFDVDDTRLEIAQKLKEFFRE